MTRLLAASLILSGALCACFDLDIPPPIQLVTQKQQSASGALYYSFYESYITSTSPHYLVRVSGEGGGRDTLYTSSVYFDFRLSGDSVSVRTCSREAGRGEVEVIEDEAFDCRSNRPAIDRFSRSS